MDIKSIICIALFVIGTECQDKIGGFRFMVGSQEGTTQSGTIEVQNERTGKWGTVCAIGATQKLSDRFGSNEAQMVCAVMGFVPFTSSEAVHGSKRPKGDGKNVMISQFKCKEAPDLNKPSTWDPNKNCQFVGWENNLGGGCNSPDNSVVVWCGPATAPRPQSTVAPDLATVPSVNCSKRNELVRLNPGPDRGRVEIRKNNTNAAQWGTICSGTVASFGQNEAAAICKMLCQSSEYAVPVPPGIYGAPADGVPIALDNLRCPSGANSTNDCAHSGWYKPSDFCNPKTKSVGVMCALEVNTPPPPPSVHVKCEGYRAYVTFNRSTQLTKDLIKLDKPYENSTCDFYLTENDKNVFANFPLIGCNETQSYNKSHILYTVSLYKDVRPNNANVIVDTPYRIPIRCALPKVNKVTAKPVDGDLITLPPQTGGQNFHVSLRLYGKRTMDGKFINELTNPAKVQLGKTIHSVLQLTGGGDRIRLVVTECNAAPSRSSGARQLPMIKNKCGEKYCQKSDCTGPLDYEVVATALNQTRYWFHFPAFKWNSADTVSQIYLTCQVYTCDIKAGERSCSASCGTAMPSTRRRRRAAEPDKTIHHKVATLQTPLQVAGDGPGILEILASLVKQKKYVNSTSALSSLVGLLIFCILIPVSRVLLK